MSLSLLLYLPFIGAACALVGKLIDSRPIQRVLQIAPLLTLLGMGVLLVDTYPMIVGGEVILLPLGGWSPEVAIVLALDGLGWLTSVLVIVITLAAGIVALSVGKYGAEFFFFLMLLVAGMEVVVLTTDIFTMFVGFEIVAIAAYILIAFDQTDHGVLAAFKYLVLSSLGIVFFLLGVFVVYREFGTLSLLEIAEAISDTTRPYNRRAVTIATVAVVVGIGVRTAFIPFHTWLPEAHAYAPHPISAVLSGVLIKVSFFALIRVVAVFSATFLLVPFMWIGGITAVVAVIWALAQHDAKRLLAYHSISQMGYVLAAFGSLSPIAISAAVFHAANHGVFKSLLFLVVGTAITMTGERDLFRMKPFGRRAPLLAIAFLIGAFSIAGIPPFNGFASKQVVLSAINAGGGSGSAIVAAMLTLASVGTVASFIKLSRIAMPTRIASSTQKETAGAANNPHVPVGAPGSRTGSPILESAPIVVLSVLCLLMGVFGLQVSRFIAATLSAPAVPLDIASSTGSVFESLPTYLYSSRKMLSTAMTVVSGFLLFRFVLSTIGQRISHRIQSAMPTLEVVLVMFIFGLGVFWGFALLAVPS